MRGPKYASAVIAVAAALTMTACGGNADSSSSSAPADGQPLVANGETIAAADLLSAARKEGKLTLYDNYPEEQWDHVLKSFTEDTGIQVDHIRLTTPNLYQRVVAEKGGGKQSADVVGFGDPTLMKGLADKGFIEPYRSPLRTSLPAAIQGNDTYETYMRILMVPVYNTQVISDGDAPKTWQDLLSKYPGKVGITPISAGGSAFTVYNFIDTKLGPNALQQLKSENPRVYESVVPLGQDLIRGEVSIAISDSGQTLQQIADGAPLKPLYFDQGVPAFPNLGAMLKGAAHPNAAKVYLNWLISKQGGEAIVKGTSEYSARSDVAGPTAPGGVTVPAPDAQNLVLPTDQDWLTRRDALNTKWNATFQG